MVQITAILATAATLFFADADAHPGQAHHQRSLAEVAASNLFRANAHRSLAGCAHSPSMRKLQERAAERRLQTLQGIHEERRRLAAADVIGTSHKSDLTGITPNKFDAVALFGATPKCVLEPESTQGPYYVTGELIRQDIREDQAGVDLYTQLQFIDVNTCEPVKDYYVDFWHCNATGVYAGVVARTNGNPNDLSNINTTFARGLYPTDEDGLVQFITKFPGHYTGRTTHIHLLASHGGNVLPNNTYVGGGAASVGQIFFDQDLVTEVEKTGVYPTNTQPLLTNAEDSIFAQEAETGFDPVVQYVYLGDSVEDGIFSWISVGIDASISKDVGAVAKLTANGGVETGFIWHPYPPVGGGQVGMPTRVPAPVAPIETLAPRSSCA